MANKAKTVQLSYWQGKFGDDYIDRNSDFKFFEKRTKFFKEIITKHKIKTVLEVGCNIGANIKIIHEINPKVKIAGIEPNRNAFKIVRKNNPFAKITNQSVFDLVSSGKYDLVFTAGVLIHIADKDINQALRKIYNASGRYILAIEYYSPRNKIVNYRGLDDALYKRPYKKVFLSLFPDLKLVDSGRLKQNQGFDDCRHYLFEKA